MLEIVANLFKTQNLNITVTKLQTLYFVEAPLAANTASSIFGCDATSLAHLYLGSFSPSSLQILDGERRRTAIFRSPEMFDWVQVQALAGTLKDIQRRVPKPLLHCLGCVLRVIVLLEGEPSPSLRP